MLGEFHGCATEECEGRGRKLLVELRVEEVMEGERRDHAYRKRWRIVGEMCVGRCRLGLLTFA